MKFLQDFHIRDVLKGGAQALTLKVLASLIGFMVSIVLGRFYGPEGIGVYALMLNIILIAATLSSTGTIAVFMHPAEASQGDLVMVERGDILKV